MFPGVWRKCVARLLLGMSEATDAVDPWLAPYQQPQDRRTWGSSNWLCLLEKNGISRLPFPCRDVYWPWWIPIVLGTTQTCRTAQCRCIDIVNQQMRSPHPFCASVWGERSCAHTKPAAVFFKWTVRELGIGRHKLSHSPWSEVIKNMFISVVLTADFGG